MRPIIVAIDFSECSFNALEHAISIAEKGNIHLRMVWVKRPDSQTTAIFEEGSEQVKTVESEFNKLIEKYKPQLPESKFDYKIREGKIHREIVAEALEINAFLIVTGTHGVSGFEEMWIGSNANKLVSVAPCPVITIQGGISINRDLTRIVMPIDSTLETRQKVPFTTVIAKLFDAEIHVLLLYSTKVQAVRNRVDSYAEQAIKYLVESEVKFKLETLEVNNLLDDVLEYTRQVDANLISIMTEMEKSARNLWLGSYAHQMVNRSPYPVLVIHPKETMRGVIGG